MQPFQTLNSRKRNPTILSPNMREKLTNLHANYPDFSREVIWRLLQEHNGSEVQVLEILAQMKRQKEFKPENVEMLNTIFTSPPPNKSPTSLKILPRKSKYKPKISVQTKLNTTPTNPSSSTSQCSTSQLEPFVLQKLESLDQSLITPQEEQLLEVDMISRNVLKDLNQLNTVTEESIKQLSQSFSNVLKLRSKNVFSESIKDLADLMSEQQGALKEFEIDVCKLAELNDHDKIIQQMKCAEKLVEEEVKKHQQKKKDTMLDVAIKKRDELRKECHTRLSQIVPQFNRVIDVHEDKAIRLKSVEALLSEFDDVQGDPKDMNIDANEALTEYNEWLGEVEKQVGEVARRTNDAFLELQESLQLEEQLLSELSEKGEKLIPKILAVGKKFCTNKIAEQFQRKINHFKELQIYYNRILKDLNSLEMKKMKMEKISKEYHDTKSNLREAKRALLKLRYKKEELDIDGASESFIKQVDQELKKQAEVVAKWEKQLQTFEEDIHDITTSGLPEVQVNLPNQMLPARICDSKLEVKRSIKDYEILESFGKRVFKVRYGGKLHILKQYSLTDELSRKQFIKEVTALARLKHPCIVAIECYFKEDNQIYVQIEYHPHGNLKQWLQAKKRQPHEICYVFHLIAQALKHIHDHGIIHCDIKPENIVISGKEGELSSLKPILIDFDISKDTQQALTSTITNGTVRGTSGYIAPEILEGNSPTSASDMWSYGCMLFRAHFPDTEPVLLPEKSAVIIPAHSNPYLRDLLSHILRKNPKKRACANDVCTHFYFTSPVEELHLSGKIVNTESKMKAFSRFLYHFKKNQSKQRVKRQLRRAYLVKDVVRIFSDITENELLRKFTVEYVNEPGDDLGGLTTSTYTEFFKQVVHPDFHVFEKPSDSPQELYLPNPNYNDLGVFEAIGKLLAKVIYDQRVIPEIFPTALFKYLTGSKITFRDLEIYDEGMAHMLNKMMSQKDVESWGLDFEDIGEPSRKVTDENKEEYKMKKVYYYLVGKRRKQLDALKKGFRAISELNTQLNVFSYSELMLLCYGQDYIDAESILKLIVIEDFRPHSPTPVYLAQLLREFSPIQLRKFLEFVTGQCGLRPGEKRKIVVRCVFVDSIHALPVSHVCGWQMDLPDYGDKDLLRRKLLMAFDYMQGSGFQYV